VKILVADDDRVSRRLLENTLARLGHEVVAVADGPSALDALTVADGPRLAILDWMMPGADGIEVCRRARKFAGRYIYVILLTARDRREDLVTAFDAEVDDFLTKPLDVVELRARLRSGERVLALQESLLDAQAALERQATHDHLTGLWNRGMIFGQLGLALERARREQKPIAVIMVDIDKFKEFNDRHGHTVGDQILKTVAARIRGVLRPYDGMGRYGGEEFLLVIEGCDAVVTHDVAERAREAVAATPIEAGILRLNATVSLGVAWQDRAPASTDGLVDAADQALYRAKAAGRNRVEYAVI
jgi:diguanylate cyclase (GGDEF)-like protein